MDNLEVKALLQKDGLTLLNSVLQENYNIFILKQSNKYPIELIRAVAEQLKYRDKLKRKQPNWFKVNALIEGDLLEQSTAEEVANFRATLINGKTLFDGTGGMGIDSLAFSKKFNFVDYCELKESRTLLFKENLHRLNSGENITIIKNNSIEQLKKSDKIYDWLFFDPARREDGQKLFGLTGTLPNIIENGKLLREKSENIGVKISPAYDLSHILKEIPDLSKIFVISLNREVKEIFFTVEKYYTDKPIVEAISLNKDGSINGRIRRYIYEEDNGSYSNILNYIYEPDPAYIKANMVNQISKELNIPRISKQTPFLTTNENIKNFVGRKFRVISTIEWHRKSIKKYIRKENIERASIIRRDFPLSPEKLRDSFKLLESSDKFLIFTTLKNGKKVMIDAKRVFND